MPERIMPEAARWNPIARHDMAMVRIERAIEQAHGHPDVSFTREDLDEVAEMMRLRCHSGDTSSARVGELLALADMTPDEFQAQTVQRFPLLADGLPTLAQLVQQHHESSRQKKLAAAVSHVPDDDDQEELLKALPGRFPTGGRANAARRHGWD